MTTSGDKVRDDDGNHLVNLSVTLDVRFPAGEEGDAARAVLPRSVDQTRDRLCTVGRTVQLGAARLPARRRLTRQPTAADSIVTWSPAGPSGAPPATPASATSRTTSRPASSMVPNVV